MRDINVAIIGGGFMAKAHSLAYASMPMFFWPAPARPIRRTLVDVTEELAADGVARFGFEKHTSDWRTVIEDPEIDVVDIATPNNLHAEIAIAAAEAGKHIICEKPLARGAEEARPVSEAARRAGIVTMVAFSYRRTPAVALAKKYIEEGAIGDILNFRGTYLQDWSADPDSPLSWCFQKAIAGSGSLGDIATHVVDLARYLVGEIAGVNSLLKTWVPDRPIQTGGVDKLGAAGSLADAERGPVDVDDEVITLLKFAGGAIGSLEATRNAHGRNNFLTFEIHGTRGSLVFNYERRDELQVCFSDDPADRRGFRTVYTGPNHPYGDALWPIPALGIGYGATKIIETYELFKAITEGIPASPDFGDGYQIEKIADAIQESAAKSQWVEITPLDRSVGTTGGGRR
ncbi:Gfo/Idh/MocA family oxidoreductase [Streptomyces rameus]|uniref:Gfo/Idh/MocA family oxidoreductase n=1 Tax=Streptomyces rameus TaxID=68261 RepID=A0ABP6MKK5_9ACTN